MIMNNNTWKLRAIPYLDEEFSSVSSYYDYCAYHMRESLTQMTLNERMLAKTGYSKLLEAEEISCW
jgi:hypothetical protein